MDLSDKYSRDEDTILFPFYFTIDGILCEICKARHINDYEYV